MAKRLSRGAFQVTSLDLPSINYMLQQIRNELDEIQGLRGVATIHGDLNVQGSIDLDGDPNTVLAFDANGDRIFLPETGTPGSVVLSESPTVTTPTLLVPVIADFSSAQHSHENVAGGNQLDHGAALVGLGDDDHSAYPLVTNFEADRATIATRWDDLTDGGATTLHTHAAGGALISVEDEGSAVVSASVLNFVGAGVVATDAGGGQADITISGGGGGGGDWALVDSFTYSVDVASVAFTGLAGYSEVMVIIRDITTSSSAFRSLQVSIDNGSTYLTSSGDYITVSNAGVATNDTLIGLHATSSASARSGGVIIRNWDLTSNKIGERLNNPSGEMTIIPTTSDLDALKVIVSAGNITGGSIFIFAK